MKKVIVRAPVRADLAGGTLDLWPLYLFHPGSRTVNVAISYYAESEVEETGDGAIEIHLSDEQYRNRYTSLQELGTDPKAALIHRALEHFHLTGIHVTLRTDAPRGSGLGGSSALGITLVRALSEMAGAPVEGENLINLVRDLETRLIGMPAGIQDYYPPVFGGLASIHLVPGAPVRHPLATPLSELAAHMLLHYSGVGRFSGTNNWQLYKRQIDGKKKVQRGLSKIAAAAAEMEKALDAGNFAAAGKALAKEWTHRKAMIDGISTPEIEAAIEVALGAGAWGGKVCGAGGGGAVVFLVPAEKKEAVASALATVPGRVLDAVPVAHGIAVEYGEVAHAGGSTSRARIPSVRRDGAIEQLYVYGQGIGKYKPFVLAESIVTHVEPRSGLHHAVTRTYLAPFDFAENRVAWPSARPANPEALDIRAVADPGRRVDPKIDLPALVQTAEQSEEALRQFLLDSERMRIYHNADFELFSEPNESRQTFFERCAEEASRRLEIQAERLESTFRRRMDQLKEKLEREQRQRSGDGDAAPTEVLQGVNVAWGQALYNITSGRPAAVAEAPQSVQETDYREKIAQIQKAWERELQILRDDLTAKAQEIEEIVVAPSPKNIEITRYVILWT